YDVASPVLTVTATGADNAISYTSDLFGRGTVAVDGFPSIGFRDQAHLAIDGQGGSDTISLNSSSTPIGLTSISVNGGDPTAGSDTLVVNGTSDTDTITVIPTGADSADVTGAGPVPIS